MSILIPAKSYAYTILVWGDSLSSAYNIPPEQGWVALMEDRIDNPNLEVINGSIPGEITYGGAQRIDSALQTHKPDLIIIGLGSNDGLQGLSVIELENNLSYMLNAAQSADARILLLGMKVPPNYGKKYSDDFDAVFTNLQSEFSFEYVPFFLEPVAFDFDLVQADGLHPTADAQPLLLDHIWPTLEPMLSDMIQ